MREGKEGKGQTCQLDRWRRMLSESQAKARPSCCPTPPMFPPSSISQNPLVFTLSSTTPPSALPEKFTACPSLFSVLVLSAGPVGLDGLKPLYLLAFSLFRVGGWLDGPKSFICFSPQFSEWGVGSKSFLCWPSQFSGWWVASKTLYLLAFSLFRMGGWMVLNPASSVPPVARDFITSQQIGRFARGYT